MLNRPEPWPTNPDHSDVQITFAPQDAIRVRFQDGQLMIGLRIAELSKGERSWKDFEVRAFYRPEVNGRAIQMVRDGVVQLISQRLNNRAQIAIRGVFSTTFSKNRPWNITADQFVQDKRLGDLTVTQLEIEDGWIGFALGPCRTAARPATQR